MHVWTVYSHSRCFRLPYIQLSCVSCWTTVPLRTQRISFDNFFWCFCVPVFNSYTQPKWTTHKTHLSCLENGHSILSSFSYTRLTEYYVVCCSVDTYQLWKIDTFYIFILVVLFLWLSYNKNELLFVSFKNPFIQRAFLAIDYLY